MASKGGSLYFISGGGKMAGGGSRPTRNSNFGGVMHSLKKIKLSPPRRSHLTSYDEFVQTSGKKSKVPPF
jgi:hypothetical protein